MERVLGTVRGALWAVLGRIPTIMLDGGRIDVRGKVNLIVILLKELHYIMPKP